MEENGTLNVTAFDQPVVPVWSRSLTTAFMSIIAALGFSGNFLIILVLTKSAHKSSTDILVFSMAVVDLICSTTAAPMFIVELTSTLWYTVNGSLFCKIRLSMLYFTTISSCLLLTAIAVDRYMLTCRPLATYNAKFNLRSKYICFLIVLFGILMGLCQIPVVDFNRTDLACAIIQKHLAVQITMSVVTMLTFIGMFVISAVCYTQVVLSIRARDRARLRQHLHAVETIRMKSKTPTPSSSRPEARSPDPKTYDRKHAVSSRKDIALHSRRLYPLRIDVSVERSKPGTSTNDRQNGSERSTGSPNFRSTSTKRFTFLQRIFLGNRSVVPHDVQIRQMVELRRSAQTTNRVTLILFLVTFVYILTWSLNWISSLATLANENDEGSTATGMWYMLNKLYMLNTVTNPMFYIFMSSRFRHRAITLCR